MSFIYTTEKMNNCRGLIRSKPPCGLMTVLFVATHCLMIMMIQVFLFIFHELIKI